MRENYQEYMYTKVRAGMHKGKYMKDVPIDYIKWAVLNLKDRGLATMYAVELSRRDKSYRKKY